MLVTLVNLLLAVIGVADLDGSVDYLRFISEHGVILWYVPIFV